MGQSSAAASAKTMRQLTQAGLPILLAVIFLNLIGSLYLAIFEPAPGANTPAIVAVHVIAALPALLLAASLTGLVKMLCEFEAGRFVSAVAGAAFKRVSVGAMIALLLHIIAAPLLIALIEGRSWREAMNFDAFGLCMLMFAAAMFTVGALLEDAAAALKAENDSIV